MENPCRAQSTRGPEAQVHIFPFHINPIKSHIITYFHYFFVVAVKKVAAEEHHGIPHSFNNDTPSLSSGYTGRSSGTGKASSRASSRGTARTNGGTGRLQDADVTGKIIELDEDVDGDFAGLGSTGYMFDMLQKSVSTFHQLNSIR